MVDVSKKAAYLLCAAALALGQFNLANAGPATQRPQPVIIDTDIGDDIDDAFALAIALQDPHLEVIGITTAWGDTRTRALLVRRLLATLGRQDVVVAQGPATPDMAPFTQKKWALGATDTTPAPDAIEFIRDQARHRPGEITLIALAPLSNIEALQRRDPGALHNLKQVVLMAGSIHAGYDQGGSIPVALPSAEYNVASAPHGLAVLLESRTPVKMFPLDSTHSGSTKSGATGYSLTDHRPPTLWRCCITSGGSSTAGASSRRPCSMQYPSCGCCSHRPAH
jgi:inosine-uridine nucleoside N-ribohydrolase